MPYATEHLQNVTITTDNDEYKPERIWLKIWAKGMQMTTKKFK